MPGLVGESHRAIGGWFQQQPRELSHLLHHRARVHVCLSRASRRAQPRELPTTGLYISPGMEAESVTCDASIGDRASWQKGTLPCLVAWEAGSLLSMSATPPRRLLRAAAMVHRRLFGGASLGVQAQAEVEFATY